MLQSVYEPGKRHWLKVKKDYLAEGAMADSADLVLLGAYHGSGSKGTRILRAVIVKVGHLGFLFKILSQFNYMLMTWIFYHPAYIIML